VATVVPKREKAQEDDRYPDKSKGLLPRIYAGSNLDALSVRGLINLFS
jgi:hypothetical protein